MKLGRSAIVILISSVVMLSLFVPAHAAVGQWRLISPTEYTGTPAANMHGVFMLTGGTSGIGSGNGWAVADRGLIFRWDGFSWNQVASPTDCVLNSVSFGGPLNPLTSISSSSGWIVGGDDGTAATGPVCAPANAAAALYFNGVGWTSYPVPCAGAGCGAPQPELRDVFLIRDVLAYAVGTENGVNGAFWIWNGVPGGGGAWSEDLVSGPVANRVNSLYITQCTGSPCAAASDGIAVGNAGTIFRFQLGAWGALASPVVGTDLFGVAMSSPTRGWAVGASCRIVGTTDGNTWTGPVSPAGCASTLRSIVMLSSSEAWAVGDVDGLGPAIVHGTSLDSAPTWTRLPASQVATTTLDLNRVTFAPSGGNVWAVGDSGVADFCLSNCSSQSGAIWSTTTSPDTIDLNSVFMVSDSDGWAVGNVSAGAPTIIRWNGGSFSWTRAPSVAPITTAPLYGVFLSGSSNGWAVGGAAGVASTFFYDGNTWTGRVVPACACVLRGVYMVSDSNSWAVGTSGVIMHSTSSGGVFTGSPAVFPGTDLYAVYFDPTSGGMVGWAAGGNGTGSAPIILRTSTGGADGWATRLLNPGGTSNGTILKSLFFQGSNFGWAAGTNSTILYWNGISWTKVPILGATGFIDIRGISVLGGPPANDGWAVGVYTSGPDSGEPVTIHYDGTTWTVTALTPAIPNPGVLMSLHLRSSTNGLAVGSRVTGVATSLSIILHLDPPGGVTAGTTITTTPTPTPTTTATTSATTVTTSSTTPATTATTSSITSTPTSVETTSAATTSVMTTTEMSTTTAVSTVTPTTSTPTTSITTPIALPAIPGFPWESIITGIMLGIIALGIARRRRHSTRVSALEN